MNMLAGLGVLALGVLAIGAAGGANARMRAPVAACDGSPDWCIVASNEMSDSAAVYIDGQVAARVNPGRTVRIPVLAGSTHLVNSCHEEVTNPGQGLLEIGRSAHTQCTDPKTVSFTTNYVDVLYNGS